MHGKYGLSNQPAPWRRNADDEESWNCQGHVTSEMTRLNVQTYLTQMWPQSHASQYVLSGCFLAHGNLQGQTHRPWDLCVFVCVCVHACVCLFQERIPVCVCGYAHVHGHACVCSRGGHTALDTCVCVCASVCTHVHEPTCVCACHVRKGKADT